MSEKRFEQPGTVLNEKGRPNPGWASAGILNYRRRDIKAPFYRIKEWDWYQVNTDRYVMQFTYGHASYAGQIGVTLFDIQTGEKLFAKDVILALPFHTLRLPESAEADNVLLYDKKDLCLRIETAGKQRRITCRSAGFEADVTLTRLNDHAMVVNVPFDESPTHFYYNHKINCMQAEGFAHVGKREIRFSGDNAWGLLDWGRGVWPFHNEWYWSNATGRLNGRVLGFNLGRGFGNTAAACENIVFYGDDLHKIGPIDITLGAAYRDPWRLCDRAGRLDLTLTPVYDRYTEIKLLWVDNHCHQMFGTFAGTVVLDDGTKLEVKDITGFAEHAVNNW